jgi:hypothetical protein
VPPYKLVLGDGPGDTLDMAGWPGPQSPNNTMPQPDWTGAKQVCGTTVATGCLYNVYADEGEHINLVLYSYCAPTVLVLYSYCTVLLLYSYCTRTVLVLYSCCTILYPYSTHTGECEAR